jgi:hypothetical protein
VEQGCHLRLKEMIDSLQQGHLPAEEKTARRTEDTLHAAREHSLLSRSQARTHHKRVAVSAHLKEQLLTEHHSSLSLE